jgi:hypothetical protein
VTPGGTSVLVDLDPDQSEVTVGYGESVVDR